MEFRGESQFFCYFFVVIENEENRATDRNEKKRKIVVDFRNDNCQWVCACLHELDTKNAKASFALKLRKNIRFYFYFLHSTRFHDVFFVVYSYQLIARVERREKYIIKTLDLHEQRHFKNTRKMKTEKRRPATKTTVDKVAIMPLAVVFVVSKIVFSLSAVIWHMLM